MGIRWKKIHTLRSTHRNHTFWSSSDWSLKPITNTDQKRSWSLEKSTGHPIDWDKIKYVFKYILSILNPIFIFSKYRLKWFKRSPTIFSTKIVKLCQFRWIYVKRYKNAFKKKIREDYSNKLNYGFLFFTSFFFNNLFFYFISHKTISLKK